MEKVGIIQEFERVKVKYASLRLHPMDDNTWEILGDLHFVGKFHSETIEDSYFIRIYIPPAYPKKIPKVWELGGRIPKDFHKFGDESLCLGTPLDVKIKFHKRPTLLGFIENGVIEYLFGYSYKLKNGILPFGERSHGIEGVIEHYKELFSTSHLIDVVNLLEFLVCGNYQVEKQCPCGSKESIEQCHGDILSRLLDYQDFAEYVDDLVRIYRMCRTFLKWDLHKYVMSFDRR